MASSRPDFNDGQTNRPVAPGKMVLTAEEMKAIKECNTESFFYRCVPLGVLFVGTSQILVNKGVLKGHPKYGALFKNISMGFFAFVLGKLSYQSKCREKIMSLENSPLAEAMRKGKSPATIFQQATIPAPQQFEDEPKAQRQDHRDGFTDMDSNIQMKGLDESKRRNADDLNPVTQSSLANEPGNNFNSYDDLRRENRAAYERRTAKASPSGDKIPVSRSSSSPAPQPAPQPAKQTDDWENQPIKRRAVRRNQYGDIIEE